MLSDHSLPDYATVVRFVHPYGCLPDVLARRHDNDSSRKVFWILSR